MKDLSVSLSLRNAGRPTAQRVFSGVAGRAAALVLSFAALCAAMSSPSSAAERIALVIGNGAYDHVPALPNPANDANLIAQKLRELDFDVDLVLDSSLDTLRERVQALSTRGRGAEKIVVFYAGHGVQLQGANFLIPTDAAIRSAGDVQARSLRVAEIYEQFGAAEPDAAVLILDACRDNPFVDLIDADQGLTSGSIGVSAFVQRPNAAGTLIAFAAAPGATAADGEDGNSPFTTALGQWIDAPSMDLTTVFRRVRATVLKLTSGQQIPWVEEALVREVFLNPQPAPARSGGVEVALLQAIEGIDDTSEQRAAEIFYDRYLQRSSFSEEQPAEAAAADDAFVQEALIWISIRGSDNPDVFRSFLETFPDSVFTQLAMVRIDELETGPPPTAVTWIDTLDPISTEAATAAPTGLTAPSTPSAPSLRLPTAPTNRPTPPPSPGGSAPSQELASLETTVPPSPSQTEETLDLSPDELRAVQVLLAEAGTYGGGADGAYGPGTRGGISEVQTLVGLADTGYLDQPTLRALVNLAAPPLLRSGRAGEYADEIHRVASVAARGPGAQIETIRMIGIQRSDRVHETWRRLADEFEAERPGIRIEIETPPEWEYKREVLQYLGSSSPPDILHTWGGGHLDAIREAGFARDLTDEMSEGWAFEFKPGALQNYTFDGRIYGAPTHLSLVSLYAHRGMLEAAGIDPASLATWEGFLSAVAHLKADGTTPLAIGGKDRWPFQLIFGNLVQRIGGRAGIEAGLAGANGGFASPPFLQAAEELDRLLEMEPFPAGYLDTGASDAGEVFASGGAAMLIAGSWRLDKIRWTFDGGQNAMRANLIQLPFPGVGERPDEQVTYGGADGYAVHVDAPDVAVEFLRRLTAIGVQEEITQAASYIPSASGADLSIEGIWLGEAADTLLQSTYHQLFLDQVLGPTAGDVLNNALFGMVTGDVSSREAMVAVDAAWSDVRGVRRQ